LDENLFISYSKKEFLGRAAEKKVVEDLISDRRKDRQTSRALILSGPRGSGKSWLAFHVVRDLFDGDGDVKRFLVRLWPGKDYTPSQDGEWWLFEKETAKLEGPVRLVSDIVDSLCKHVGLGDLVRLPLPDRVHNLALQVADWPKHKVLLLVIDSAFEGPRRDEKYADLLDTLQDLLVTPLLRTGRVVAVVTGRGAQPAWSSPYLRDAMTREMPSFEEKHIRDILRYYGSAFENNWPEVEKMTGGMPLTLWLLAQSKAKTLKGALGEAIHGLLSIIPPEQPELVEAIERLALLNRPFRPEEVRSYITGLDPEDPDGRAEKRLKNILDKLAVNSIIEWKREGGESGFLIDRSLAAPLRYQLEFYRPEDRARYRGEAAAQFRLLAEKMADTPTVAKYYRALAARFEDIPAG
jgi:hypothetical protein